MSEIHSYENQVKKMQGLCEEHDLVYRFRKEQYPLTFTIKPSRSMDAQMSMLENVEDVGYRSPDASMTWIFNDGLLETKVRGGTFTISKTLRTKIENILIKMITYWHQYFFRSVIENGSLTAQSMPKIDDEALWPEDATPFADDEPEGAPDEPCGEADSDAPDSAVGLPDGEQGDSGSDAPVSLDDPEINEAARIVRAKNGASCSLLRREMHISNAKAVRLLDALETLGVVGPHNGSNPREVLPYDEPDDEEAMHDDEA